MFNGARLDDIVDYLTFVFVPVVMLRHVGLLPAGAGRPGRRAAAVLLSSAYGFSRLDAQDGGPLLSRVSVVLEHRRGYMVAFPLRRR